MKKLLVCLYILSTSAWGQSDLDKKATEMERNLIAPCCWSKTIDQEQSEAAQYMKNKIRQALAQGQSVESIYQSFEAEFGERILANPKKSGFNWIVWIFPILVMLIGSLLLVRKITKLAPVGADPNHSEPDDLDETIIDASKNRSTQDQDYINRIDKELYR